MSPLRFSAALLPVLFAASLAVAADTCDLPLVFEENFEKGADHWQPTDESAWKISEADSGKVYSLTKRGSSYKPPHRSPGHIALLKDVAVGDFVLTVRVKNTQDTGAHQDACIFFGYQDPAHFYYVHLGKRPDPNSSQIMIVNDAPRKMITANKSPGIPWDDRWHNVKVARSAGDGTIKIYFDDMEKPVMIANDKTFGHGRIGIGSFDDLNDFDDLKLYGKKVEELHVKPAEKKEEKAKQ
jgi:hypothetical protein